jgi:hypothetical protein
MPRTLAPVPYRATAASRMTRSGLARSPSRSAFSPDDDHRINTSVTVLPCGIRSSAKQIATADHLSGGRVIFGVGVGWMAGVQGSTPVRRSWASHGRVPRAMKA